MPEAPHPELKSALEVVRQTPMEHARNGIPYARYGTSDVSAPEIEEIVQVIPGSIAMALSHRAYIFVPLVLSRWAENGATGLRPEEDGPDQIMIASEISAELSDIAVCHRNTVIAQTTATFLSIGLMPDRFALAFELYINVGHQFVDSAGIPESFMGVVWSQAESGTRGETSMDAWEYRAAALGQTASGPTEGRRRMYATGLRRSRERRARTAPAADPKQPVIDEKARIDYLRAAFADAIAIYLLSLALDFDYSELREREYPLLAAPALAERLRIVAEVFPPNHGTEFSIHHRGNG